MLVIRTRRHVCFATIEVDHVQRFALSAWAPQVRDRLQGSGADISIVDLADRRCTFVVDEAVLGDLRHAAVVFQASVRVHMRCARIWLSQRRAAGTVPGVEAVGAAMAVAGIRVRYLVASPGTLSLFVDERDVRRAQSELTELLSVHGLERGI